MDSNNNSSYDYHKKRRRAALYQCILATVPLFGILVWLLIKVAVGESKEFESANQNNEDEDATVHVFLDLQELLSVFTAILYISSFLWAHIELFVPQTKKLYKKYAEDGIIVFGDVTDYVSSFSKLKLDGGGSYQKSNRYAHLRRICKVYDNVICCRTKRRIFSAVYTVDGQQYQKNIQTAFPWHRERIPFLILPDKHRSGLPKADIELHVSNYGNHYSKGLKYVAIFWVLFSAFGCIFTMLNFKEYYRRDDDDNDYDDGVVQNDDMVEKLLKQEHILRNFIISISACVPVTLLVTYLRFLLHYRFLVKSGKKKKERSESQIECPIIVNQKETNETKINMDNEESSTSYVAIT